jgi:hypothetical protein
VNTRACHGLLLTLKNHLTAAYCCASIEEKERERWEMMEKEFERFLRKDPNLTGKHGVEFRMSKARKLEEMLGKSLDEVVIDDDAMYDHLMMLKPLEDPAHNPLQNVLRKYYLFKRNLDFPRLQNYRKTGI